MPITLFTNWRTGFWLPLILISSFSLCLKFARRNIQWPWSLGLCVAEVEPKNWLLLALGTISAPLIQTSHLIFNTHHFKHLMSRERRERYQLLIPPCFRSQQSFTTRFPLYPMHFRSISDVPNSRYSFLVELTKPSFSTDTFMTSLSPCHGQSIFLAPNVVNDSGSLIFPSSTTLPWDQAIVEPENGFKGLIPRTTDNWIRRYFATGITTCVIYHNQILLWSFYLDIVQVPKLLDSNLGFLVLLHIGDTTAESILFTVPMLHTPDFLPLNNVSVLSSCVDCRGLIKAA